MPKSKFEAFQIVTVHRSQINPAPYNPRLMDMHAERKLSDAIEHFGLIEDLVWNSHTKTLIGGHQRLAMLDYLEGHEDYLLDVAAVAIKDLKKEKRLNVALNNPEIRGEYNVKMLGDLLQQVGIQHTAFDAVDLQMMGVALTNSVFGRADSAITVSENLGAIHKAALDAKKQASAAEPENQAETESASEAETDATKKTPDGTFAALEKKFAAKAAERDAELEFYIVAVFKNPAEQKELLQLLNYETAETTIDGEALNAQLASAAAAIAA